MIPGPCEDGLGSVPSSTMLSRHTVLCASFSLETVNNEVFSQRRADHRGGASSAWHHWLAWDSRNRPQEQQSWCPEANVLSAVVGDSGGG